jgi:hypothetical protein
MIPTYTNHQNFIETVLDGNIGEIQFKNNANYNNVLENLSRDNGVEYLSHIETEFPQVTFEDIRSFIMANDKNGGSIKTIFTMKNMKLLYCSPSNLRYIYHALLILSYYKETNCKNIVELGQGYGGLFLAINMFMNKIPDIVINKYIMIDLPNSSKLTTKYLEAHVGIIHIPSEIYDSTMIDNIAVPITECKQSPNDTFFISNYCFTAIDSVARENYVDKIIQPCSHGFLTWQTCFGANVHTADDILKKSIVNRPEETPQTAPKHVKNHYVYF